MSVKLDGLTVINAAVKFPTSRGQADLMFDKSDQLSGLIKSDQCRCVWYSARRGAGEATG